MIVLQKDINSGSFQPRELCHGLWAHFRRSRGCSARSEERPRTLKGCYCCRRTRTPGPRPLPDEDPSPWAETPPPLGEDPSPIGLRPSPHRTLPSLLPPKKYHVIVIPSFLGFVGRFPGQLLAKVVAMMLVRNGGGGNPLVRSSISKLWKQLCWAYDGQM